MSSKSKSNSKSNSNLIEYLKSPELVVQFQEYFGIKYLNKEDSKTNNTLNTSLSQNGQIKTSPSNSTSAATATEEEESSATESQTSAPTDKKDLPYRIENKFWYYLFIFGTELGDEIFYASFIPFWFWNVDSAVGRRVIFLWSIVMYVGQSLKDIIRWPRPGRPVSQLQSRWALEYGMPSTHAMVAVSIPFSVFIFTQQRYLYPAYLGLSISILWCTIVCLSRIYLGMHSVLDVLAGLVLTFSLMIVLIPLVDYLDFFIVQNIFSPIFVICISILLVYCYPQPKEKWTPTRGDTTMTISVCAGLQIGAWLTYQLGASHATPPTEPHEIIWPTYQMIGHLILRTVFGMCCIMATRAIGKSITYAMACAALGKDKNEVRNSPSSLQNKIKTIVELSHTYLTYGLIGINTHYFLPIVFKLIGIGRPDFYTEI